MSLHSEAFILELIDTHFPRTGLSLEVGRGDDCAVWRPQGALCVSTDLFMEDVHFRRSYFSPPDIGWKALAVNLSDIAAMGAVPTGFSLGLALPPDADVPLVDGLLSGMAELAHGLSGLGLPLLDKGVALTGGDISRAEKLHLCLTVFGEVQDGTALCRGQCAPGDAVFMVGRAGLARLGLLALEEFGASAKKEYPEACAAHVRPVPRLKEGLRLSALARQLGGRMGLMDVSDGLMRDLPRLVGENRGADIAPPPIHEEWRRYAAAKGWDNARLVNEVLRGGEEYALVGTCEGRHAAQVMVMLPEATLLGKVTNYGFLCGDERFSGGFDHFTA